MSFQVVYCGGCNPTYDRTAFVRELEEVLGEAAVPESCADILAVYVSGCSRQCVKGDGIAVFQAQPPQMIADAIQKARGESRYGKKI